MNITNISIINIYSILFLIIIYVHAQKHGEKTSLQHKLYKRTLIITILMLFVDILSRFDGKPDTIYPVINHIGNFMVFLLSPVIPSMWLLFAYDYVCPERDIKRHLVYPLLAINMVHVVLLVLSQFYGWFYYIDSHNIYHRGPLFLLSASVTAALLFTACIFIVANRKRIDKKLYYPLLLFAIAPFICIILQLVFYGVSLILQSLVISLLIVYLNVQNHSMYTDYLTEVYNRKKLEIYLKKKISTSTENKSFSAIMIDLDNFKSINDDFGHDMGDDALQNTAKLLKSCLRSNDFIARFGGDEFYIVLNSSDTKDLEIIVARINSCIENYNSSDNRLYKLGFSLGYAVYDYHSCMDAEDFKRHIDTLMYEDKRVRNQ